MGFEIVLLPERKSLAPLAGLTSGKGLPVLASAVLGKADVLVTGDKQDLLKMRKHDLGIAEFKKAIGASRTIPISAASSNNWNGSHMIGAKTTFTANVSRLFMTTATSTGSGRNP
jgi:hypothetical protein